MPPVRSGQKSVASIPDSVQMVTLTWRLQYSVGTLPSAKYSVFTMLPRGSESQCPAATSLPDFLHMVAVVMFSGIIKSLYSRFAWIRDITARQMDLG